MNKIRKSIAIRFNTMLHAVFNWTFTVYSDLHTNDSNRMTQAPRISAYSMYRSYEQQSRISGHIWILSSILGQTLECFNTQQLKHAACEEIQIIYAIWKMGHKSNQISFFFCISRTFKLKNQIQMIWFHFCTIHVWFGKQGKYQTVT